MLTMLAVLIASVPNGQYIVIPQENLESCNRVMHLLSLDWRNTEFNCIPTTNSESLLWYPEKFGPVNTKAAEPVEEKKND